MSGAKPNDDFIAQCPRIFHRYARILKERNTYYNKSFAWEWAADLVDKRVLEAGCGYDSALGGCQPPLRQVVGLDPILNDLRRNPHVGWRTQGIVEALPFKSESFDAVYCDSVFEHIDDPDKTCREFFRVLKPGGKVLINTNSIFNPFMFPNKFLSIPTRERLKDFLGIRYEDTYRAPYRVNTRARLRRYLSRAGFRNLRFYRWGLPAMMRPKWFLSLELCMGVLSEIPLFSGLKDRLMVTCEK